ncbi:MAG: PQQ-binding-like beta-propeller repeat protein, partial [Verrucomicrobiales bacterium]|nr:PQQ-binding-like beta-propeller repeat protein [Verrucomicrobiales bacterium]
DAETGNLIWKVNGGPERRWILGNQRMISMWPSRGGPVLHEGKLYFAASIWPFMGIFIHAVEPESGEVIWTNSGDGTNYTIQPHNAPAFASVVPQGHLAAQGDNLVVPGGRSTPAVYSTKTGEQRHFKFDKRNGGHNVGAATGLIFVAGRAYKMADGTPIGGGAPAVFNSEMQIASDPSAILARRLKPNLKTRESTDRRGNKVIETIPEFETIFRTQLSERMPGTVVIAAGERLFSGGPGKIASWKFREPDPDWEIDIAGEVYTMLAGDDRLFAVTREGKLYCFGEKGTGQPSTGRAESNPQPASDSDTNWAKRAADVLSAPGASEGYGLVIGIGSGRLIDELLKQSDLHLIAIDPEPEKVRAIRERMADAGLYGSRFSAFVGDPKAEKLPPYFCNVITSEEPFQVGAYYKLLRPYGGVEVSLDENGTSFTTSTRSGPIPNTDDWTHQYANAAQTIVSRDKLVKAPFGVLWFGGPSHEGILPRHGHGPSPQVAGGRLFIEGPDILRAVDVYTGRKLWERELPGLGTYYNTTAHFAGAGEIGSNYVSLPDQVYAVLGEKILALDPETGDTTREFKAESFFGHIAVEGDFLVATSAPVAAGEAKKDKTNPTVDLKDAKPVIPPNSEWHYFAGELPGKNWEDRDFKPGEGWKKGQAGFGYGDGDDKTTIDMRGKFSTVFIRRDFDSKDAGGGDLILSVMFDDAFVAYLNGTEVVREGVDKKSGQVKSHEADRGFEQFKIDSKHLRDGRNVIAIEGHNVGVTSSDFTLHPVLLAKGSKDVKKPKSDKPVLEIPTTRYSAGSRRLVVYNRHTGEQLWDREAVFNFRHNNIAVAGDRIFCIDKLTDDRANALARRGIELEGKRALYALDLKTGEVIWEHDEHVFGTFLNYSAEHDIVLQAGSKFRDRASDDIGRGMMALRGKTGDVIWHDPDVDYAGPCLLWHDKILTNGNGGFALNLLTGKPTGWKYNREYGCNTAIGSEHLLTFRSGAAGFFDLTTDSGTGNLGGFRSSCTNNLIAANGVLNAPDYTRTCSCSYQNQTSLALIHMPEAEFWTFGGNANPDRVGVNFGAPGDRRSEDGTLFCEFPNTGSRSDEAEVKIDGKIQIHRAHSSMMEGGPDPWLTASSVEGAEKIEIELPDSAKGKTATVRLWFAEPDRSAEPGDRVFEITIAGTSVAEKMDVAAEAGGSGIGIVKDFSGIEIEDEKVRIEFDPSAKNPPIVSAVEIDFSR